MKILVKIHTVKVKKRGENYGIGRYVLLFWTLSFLGWAFETLYTYLSMGIWQDRGFLMLPFCSIYGWAFLLTYLLLGTPQKGRGILKKCKKTSIRYLIYALFCFLLPTFLELIVGIFSDKVLHLSLWTYRNYPMNIDGYICLPVSMVWGVLLFIFMRFFFLPLKKLVGVFPKPLAFVLAIILMLCVSMDWTARLIETLRQR